AGRFVEGHEFAFFARAAAGVHVYDEQGLGDEGTAAAVAADGGQVEIFEERVIPNGVAVAVGRRPGDVAGVEVDGRDARVGRLEEGQALGTARVGAAAAVGVAQGPAFLRA